jgi:hypothetical protein
MAGREKMARARREVTRLTRLVADLPMRGS